MGRPLKLTPELREALCGHLAQGAHVKTACQAVGISEVTYYRWQARGNRGRDEQAPTLELSRQELIDLLAEADVTYPARATKTELLRLLTTTPSEEPYREFREATTRARGVRWSCGGTGLQNGIKIRKPSRRPLLTRRSWRWRNGRRRRRWRG